MPAEDSDWDQRLVMQFLVWRGAEKKYGFPLESALKIEAISHREAAEQIARTMAFSGCNMHLEYVFVALAGDPAERLKYRMEMSFKAAPA